MDIWLYNTSYRALDSIRSLDGKTVVVIFCITYLLGLKGIYGNFEKERRFAKRKKYGKKRTRRY